jgi:hypothetical protein
VFAKPLKKINNNNSFFIYSLYFVSDKQVNIKIVLKIDITYQTDK